MRRFVEMLPFFIFLLFYLYRQFFLFLQQTKFGHLFLLLFCVYFYNFFEKFKSLKGKLLNKNEHFWFANDNF